jgi:hypothetical protein
MSSGRPAVILHCVDAFDPERTNSARPRWHTYCYGCSGRLDLSYSGQYRHGGRLHASHRNTFTPNELRGIIGTVYVSRTGDGHERPHAPLRELKQSICCVPGASGLGLNKITTALA